MIADMAILIHFSNKNERMKKMVQISREEAMAIRENLRGVHVSVTNRQSKAKKRSYYVEESGYVMRFLNSLRSKQKVEHFE